ncbi:N-alpha-acetyltransferase 30 [Lampetra planeri]
MEEPRPSGPADPGLSLASSLAPSLSPSLSSSLPPCCSPYAAAAPCCAAPCPCCCAVDGGCGTLVAFAGNGEGGGGCCDGGGGGGCCDGEDDGGGGGVDGGDGCEDDGGGGGCDVNDGGVVRSGAGCCDGGSGGGCCDVIDGDGSAVRSSGCCDVSDGGECRVVRSGGESGGSCCGGDDDDVITARGEGRRYRLQQHHQQHQHHHQQHHHQQHHQHHQHHHQQHKRRGLNGCVPGADSSWHKGDEACVTGPAMCAHGDPRENHHHAGYNHDHENHVDNHGGVGGARTERAGSLEMRLTRCSLGEERPDPQGVRYISYKCELQMPDIMRLITKDLSEPYSIYTYRYFIHNWPQLCFLAMAGSECVGAIVCKLDLHKKMIRRGYIAMLAVDSKHRKHGIGTNLVKKAIYAMVEGDCDEVVLETEVTNKSALRLYENLGFVRDKRLFRYYLNGVDALRLKLWLR